MSCGLEFRRHTLPSLRAEAFWSHKSSAHFAIHRLSLEWDAAIIHPLLFAYNTGKAVGFIGLLQTASRLKSHDAVVGEAMLTQKQAGGT